MNLDVNTKNAEPVIQRQVFQSRMSIFFVAIVFGAISAFSVFGFFFNLTIKYPGTDRTVIAVDPLWMLGHVIRGLGLGAVTYQLCRYQSALKHFHGATGPGVEQLLSIHTSAWKTGAYVLAALTVYSIIYVAFGGPKIN